MKIRKLHRIIGIILLLPLFGWAITGLVFFVKPGYAGAYEFLNPKTYPLEGSLSITPDPAWREIRCFRTILGEHLLARTDTGWVHLNPENMQLRSAPTNEEIKLLLTDAFLADPQRYGHVISISDDVIQTNTGIEITIDWNSLSLQQRGRDTDFIDQLYKIHYLQWTGVKSIDKILGVAGIALVILLSLLGIRLAFKQN